MKKGEKEGESEGELTLSKCQNKAENTECFTHTRLYANDMSCVHAGKCVHVCVLVRMHLCFLATAQGLCNSLSHGCAWVCVCVHKLSLCCISLRMLQMQKRVRACVRVASVWYCVILQIRKTCRWVKSH